LSDRGCPMCGGLLPPPPPRDGLRSWPTTPPPGMANEVAHALAGYFFGTRPGMTAEGRVGITNPAVVLEEQKRALSENLSKGVGPSEIFIHPLASSAGGKRAATKRGSVKTQSLQNWKRGSGMAAGGGGPGAQLIGDVVQTVPGLGHVPRRPPPPLSGHAWRGWGMNEHNKSRGNGGNVAAQKPRVQLGNSVWFAAFRPMMESLRSKWCPPASW